MSFLGSQTMKLKSLEVITMRKNLLKTGAILMLLTFVVSMCSIVCFAQPGSLNEIGGSQAVEQVQDTEPTKVIGPANSSQKVPGDVNLFDIDESKVSESNKSSADAVGEIFKQGGLTQESVEKSKKYVEPIAKILNLLVAIVTSLLALGIVCVSVLDLVYIQLPFARAFLAPTQSSPSAPMQGQMGMMHGAPNSMQSSPSAGSTSAGTGKQWVSDEAIAALNDAQPQQVQQGMIGQGQPVKAGGKSALVSYAKKRSFSLIMLGICIILFTCTVFTDIGTMVGMKLIALLSGISL